VCWCVSEKDPEESLGRPVVVVVVVVVLCVINRRLVWLLTNRN
jgi:hypothetical protein